MHNPMKCATHDYVGGNLKSSGFCSDSLGVSLVQRREYAQEEFCWTPTLSFPVTFRCRDFPIYPSYLLAFSGAL